VHVGLRPPADHVVRADEIERGEAGVEDEGDLHAAYAVA
jgi:hypothetical protein